MSALIETKLFAISEVSEITGVNSVTLRAWQRRYGLLIPQRTPKGHRLYTEADIAKIKVILDWLAKGVSIGKVKPLLAGDCVPVVEQQQTLDVAVEIINAVQALNGFKLERLINEALKIYPYEVIQQRLLPEVSAVIEHQDNPLITVQRSLWSSVLTVCFINVITKINNEKKLTCLLISFDQHISHSIWQQGLAWCYKGDGVTIMTHLSGRLTGISACIRERNIKNLVVVGETKLSRRQLDDIEMIEQETGVKLHFVGSVKMIHGY
ncbi:MerR family transcriptional regulator [Photobacterium kishitanii]|uniref:Helix-turn-helix-type transcriptional regulator n=1 Tax=Photobacterium kishitanii TaxID=318456 RepID=A0AAX0Z173_9GAMM|nr:MerR family transcriptional regulator [Photobacterium kishitanii]KJG10783.1 MerR family transcriptional regulator [Photobacterium kishitanii]KJG59788.1 MerR family transcriptional regulator [Photobacterium kishitanii]KJG63074.1 MerR family transcriptional regulator [Photobacterium kishitanii]KJG67910.1 MerR family transcriptional regulator [Photobacterium kishitanii]KJG71251.1 MerR family transcriptional regulator [Photobacterium kishitanii]